MSLVTKKCFWVVFIFLACTVLSIGVVVYTILKDNTRDPIVTTENGILRGLRGDDGDYFMYLGIPYAEVNVSNVFGPATPQKVKWIYNANDDSYTCPHYDFINKKVVKGTFDCLRLNIYVPFSANPSYLRPVLIFIPGYEYLSVNYEKQFLGPKFLMKQDIILVVINYRVGPYGFLCVDHPEFSGNQGLKDQILAFKWIRENIKYFGGDPSRMTLAGENSGGRSANLHLLYGEEVFQNVIIDSGIHKDQIQYKNKLNSVAIALAKQLGCKSSNGVEALEFLNSQHPEDVIEASMKLNIEYYPCIEPNRDDAFITKDRLKSISNNLKRTPILIMQSEIEATGEYYLQELNDTIFLDVINKTFKFHDDDVLKRMEAHVSKFYLGENKISNNVRNDIINFWTDIYVNYPTKLMIKKYLEHGSNDIYYGIFTYPGTRSLEKIIYNIDVNETLTGDNLGYLFDVVLFKKTLTHEEQNIVDLITTLWANFVKYSNPTPKLTETIPIKWSPVEEKKLNFMEITTALTMKTVPYHSRMAFWDLFCLKNEFKRTKYNIEPWF